MTAETESAATETADTATPAATETAATSSTESTDRQEAPQAEATTEATEEADKATPEAPETYEFTVPEGMELDQAALDRFTPKFKELGLTQEQAQSLVSTYAEQIAAMSEGAGEAFEQAYQERRTADTAKASEGWLEALKADKEIGGDKFDPVKQRVMAAVGAVATPEMKDAMNELGWGNHPELVRLVHRLIDYVPQDEGAGPAGAGGANQPIEARMYPGMNK